MQILLSKIYDPAFVYYFRDYTKEACLIAIDKIKLNKLDKEFNIDSYDILVKAINSLKVYESTTSYEIAFDKNKKYNGDDFQSLINMITYGSRTCQGYPVIGEVFNKLVDNIDYIYEEWQNEH